MPIKATTKNASGKPITMWPENRWYRAKLLKIVEHENDRHPDAYVIRFLWLLSDSVHGTTIFPDDFWNDHALYDRPDIDDTEWLTNKINKDRGRLLRALAALAKVPKVEVAGTLDEALYVKKSCMIHLNINSWKDRETGDDRSRRLIDDYAPDDIPEAELKERSTGSTRKAARRDTDPQQEPPDIRRSTTAGVKATTNLKSKEVLRKSEQPPAPKRESKPVRRTTPVEDEFSDSDFEELLGEDDDE